jgi:uncharacterized repeat protein (TIGR03803 family)
MSFRSGSAIALFLGALVFSDRSGSAVLAPRAHGSSEKVLHQFRGGSDGLEPSDNLVVGTNGDLYGTTQGGGSPGDGTVFALTLGAKGASERVIYDFQGGKDGANPQAGLLAGQNGVLFGTTASGGYRFCSEHGCGTAFELIPSGTSYSERIIHRFGKDVDGISPEDTLVAGGNGSLFGTTRFGGPQFLGTVFELTPSGNGFHESILHDFQLRRGDGEYPKAGVIVDASGALYGATTFGGTSKACGDGCGTIYKLTPSSRGYRETVIYSFQDSPDGAVPYGDLLEDGSGSLYGTTGLGGILSSDCPSGCGTVFKLTPTTSGYIESVPYSFKGEKDGSGPQTGLTAGSNGVLYGTTEYGGAGGAGTVYSLTPSRSGYAERVVHSFEPGDGGANPTAGLLFGANGELYGTTSAGGRFPCGSFGGCGVAFELMP